MYALGKNICILIQTQLPIVPLEPFRNTATLVQDNGYERNRGLIIA